jgi:hypothetical protein
LSDIEAVACIIYDDDKLPISRCGIDRVAHERLLVHQNALLCASQSLHGQTRILEPRLASINLETADSASLDG